MDYSQNWELFLGVPHASVTNLEGVDPQSDGKKGTPLGVNNDPKQVFTMKKIDGEPVLHISGEIYGALSSLDDYENYHLRLQFKWGEKKWEPRLNRLKDSGLLYHCQAPHGMFWNVWMQSQEFQVQESDVGDFYALSTTQMEIPAARKPGEKEFNYQKGAQRQLFSNADKTVPTHCNKGFDNENPHGEWNTLELICLGDQSLHIVNGKVVMALFESKFATQNGEIKSLTKGKIQIQSEGAEIFYKNIEIKPINSIPKQFLEQF
ncbi:MAG: DUF1080 domain-containing protein [Saprospiraceae bacterium]